MLQNALKPKATRGRISPSPHDTGSNVNLVDLVTGGNPPNVFMEANPASIATSRRCGLGLALTRSSTDRLHGQLPDVVKQTITVDGKIVKVPTAIHIDGMVYYNMEVAEKAGVDPTAWKSLDADVRRFREDQGRRLHPARRSAASNGRSAT